MNQSRHHLAEVIAEKAIKTSDNKLLAKEIAAYLLDENQTTNLESLIRDIMQYRLDKGVVEVTAVSASELPQNVIDDVKKLVESEFPASKNIIVNQKRDNNVIGGVKLEFPNQQLDMTVKAKLNKFKRLTATGKE